MVQNTEQLELGQKKVENLKLIAQQLIYPQSPLKIKQ